jgi:hypothetical protein
VGVELPSFQALLAEIKAQATKTDVAVSTSLVGSGNGTLTSGNGTMTTRGTVVPGPTSSVSTSGTAGGATSEAGISIQHGGIITTILASGLGLVALLI